MKLRIDLAIIIEVPADRTTTQMLDMGYAWAGKNLPLTDAVDWSTEDVEQSDGYLP